MNKEPASTRTRLRSLRVLRSISSRARRVILIISLAIASDACTSRITIEQPANNATITLPSSTSVVITGSEAFTNLQVAIDGTDFSGLMVSSGPNRAQGNFFLLPGLHTITATATLGNTQSRDTKTFVVVTTCARAANPPVIAIDPNFAASAQVPGRRRMGYALRNGDGVDIIVDDAPGLPRTSMLVEVDIDPGRGVTSGGMVEAWPFCLNGPAVNAVVSDLAGGFGTGAVCNPLTAANDFRSGCTVFSPPMLIDQSTTSELWLRKKQPFGNFDFVEGVDSSMWPAFGGRRVRFIWFR